MSPAPTTPAPAAAIVIDACAQTRQFVSESMVRTGATALIAETSAAAVRTFAARRPDAVLIDGGLLADDADDDLVTVRGAWSKAALVPMIANPRSKRGAGALRRARSIGAMAALIKPVMEQPLLDTLADAVALTRRGARRPQALVIDDSRTVRAFARSALSKADWRAHVAESVEDALALPDVWDVDVVVCDVFMPGIGGVAGIAHLAKRWPGRPIVAMSSGLAAHMKSSDALRAAIKSGAAHALEKPFTADELVATLTALRATTPSSA